MNTGVHGTGMGLGNGNMNGICRILGSTAFKRDAKKFFKRDETQVFGLNATECSICSTRKIFLNAAAQTAVFYRSAAFKKILGWFPVRPGQ